MKVFNLTDQARHGKEPSSHLVKVEGREIRPGSKAEVPKVNLARVSGMIYSGRIALDKMPDWYIQARRQRRRSISEGARLISPRVRQEFPVMPEEASPSVEEKDEN